MRKLKNVDLERVREIVDGNVLTTAAASLDMLTTAAASLDMLTTAAASLDTTAAASLDMRRPTEAGIDPLCLLFLCLLFRILEHKNINLWTHESQFP